MKNGRVISLWSYADLSIESVSADNGATRGELDKSGLALEPVIVSQYFRRHGDKIVFVDSYSSHRWKQSEKAGEWRGRRLINPLRRGPKVRYGIFSIFMVCLREEKILCRK
jgi:hypothetical protein